MRDKDLHLEAVDLVIADKLFRAMRSLLFSLSNSASSLGTRSHTKANLIKEASSLVLNWCRVDRFSPAADSLSLNSRLDTLESV